MGVEHLQDHDLQRFELFSWSAYICLLKPDLEGVTGSIDQEITDKCTCTVTMDTSWHHNIISVQTDISKIFCISINYIMHPRYPYI